MPVNEFSVSKANAFFLFDPLPLYTLFSTQFIKNKRSSRNVELRFMTIIFSGIFENIYHMRETIFHRDIHTPKMDYKITELLRALSLVDSCV